MPAKRRTPKNRDHPITPDAVAAYRAGDWLRLHRTLGLRPWQGSPLDAKGARPRWWAEADWNLAAELREELEAAHAG